MIDYEKLFAVNNISTSRRKDWVQIQCPLCGDQGKHGGFHVESEAYTCFRCGKHRSTTVLSLLLNLPPEEVWKAVREYKTDFVTGQASQEKVKTGLSKFELPVGTKNCDYQHREYLHKRKFDPKEIISKYRLKGTGYIGDYSHRIVIPIYYKDRMVSYQTRDITGLSELRYKACPTYQEIVHHKDILYNLDNCKLDKVLVVEGVFDVFRLGDNTCATFGTGFRESQVLLLGSRFKTIFILFDNEEAAQDKAEQLAYELSSLGKDTELLSLPYKDPGEIPADKVKEIKDEIF